jgi:hypothetical protein
MLSKETIHNMSNTLMLATPIGLFTESECEKAIMILKDSLKSKEIIDEQFGMNRLRKRWLNSKGLPCSRTTIYNAENNGLSRIRGRKAPTFWLSEIIRYENTEK